MNRIFFALVAIAVVLAGFRQLTWRPVVTAPQVQAAMTGDGTVLVVGGGRAETLSGETWRDVPTPPGAGGVLVAAAGGALWLGGAQPTPRVVAWNTTTWVPVASLPIPVADPSVLVLSSGQVLVVGGHTTSGLNDWALAYDPTFDTWRILADGLARVGSTLTELPGGQVLILGGHNAAGQRLGDALVLDPSTGKVRSAAPPYAGRTRHAAVLVGEQVVLVGGDIDRGIALTIETYDPVANTWSPSGRLPKGIYDPKVMAIGDTALLVAAGRWPNQQPIDQGVLWTSGQVRSVALPRPTAGAALVQTPEGPLVLGGTGRATASVYNPATQGWASRAPKAPMETLTSAILETAENAVMKLVFPLIGVMAFFLGIMRVAEEGGLMIVIAKLVRPLMVRLFPEVPANHPAMGAMMMNMAANALGLGNAATPFGIRAMEQLDTLNPHPGTATNAMALFLAINTSSVTVLPTGVIAIRAAMGSSDPAGIVATTLFATVCSTTAAIVAAKTYQRWSPVPEPTRSVAPVERPPTPVGSQTQSATDPPPQALAEGVTGAYPTWVSAVVFGLLLLFVPFSLIYSDLVRDAALWVVPLLTIGLLGYGVSVGVPVYESFIRGAKEGFEVASRIIPFVVGILVVVAMVRDSGAMGAVIGGVGSVTAWVGLPGEALPMALLRPLSGSGALGIMMETMSHPKTGPDTYVGYLVSTLQGSTETTFYVLAVYFGAVQVKRIRHTMAAALTADAIGVMAAVVACSLLVG